MGWENRNYDVGPREPGESRIRAVLRRIFGNGENPFDWALPLYEAWGIRVRIHLIFVFMILGELIAGLIKDQLAWEYKLLGMSSLFVLVLAHEYGHCIACRWVGGSADQILMWPLGGLAFCAPPHHWRADLITTLGGPGVNAVLAPILGAVLLGLGQGWSSVVFNPFDPGLIQGGLHLSDGSQPFWLVAVWWFHYTNLILLLFNMLLPMYPMDAGRVLHAIMWRSIGHRKALRISAVTGLVLAVLVFVVGVTTNQSRLTAVAIFGGITCWWELRRLAADVSDPSLAGYDFERGYKAFPDDPDEGQSTRASRAREKQRKKDEADQAELDRILAKIATSGMGNLTRWEKRWLERASERKRRG